MEKGPQSFFPHNLGRFIHYRDGLVEFHDCRIEGLEVERRPGAAPCEILVAGEKRVDHSVVPATALANPGVLAAGNDVVAELEIVARLGGPDSAPIVIDDEAKVADPANPWNLSRE
jgi:hypothetical protein